MPPAFAEGRFLHGPEWQGRHSDRPPDCRCLRNEERSRLHLPRAAARSRIRVHADCRSKSDPLLDTGSRNGSAHTLEYPQPSIVLGSNEPFRLASLHLVLLCRNSPLRTSSGTISVFPHGEGQRAWIGV